MAQYAENTNVICLTGPESTGKSTLAVALAQHLQALLVTEYAREYLNQQPDNGYTPLDLQTIARQQQLLESRALAQSPDYLILDTDIQAIAIWWDIRFGKRPRWLEAAMAARRPRRYLLLYPDVAWEIDPLRESANQRLMLFSRYLDDLQMTHRDYRTIRGQGSERFNTCLAACLETVDQR